MAAKKKAKPKKKAAKKAAKKKVVKTSAKKPMKKKVAKKPAKKSAKRAVKKTARKATKKSVAKAVKKVAKATKPKAAKPTTPKGKPVTFMLDAPYGWDVSLAGSFNNWEPRAMVKEADGMWRLTVYLSPGSYQYRFLVDTEWKDDPNNSQLVPNEYGAYNSVIDVS